MKQFYLLLVAIFMLQTTQAQIVNIGDPFFKGAILNTGIDTNGDGEIQVSEAQTLTSLTIGYNYIKTFEGLQHFTNLINLSIGGNDYGAQSIDFRGLQNLETLRLYNSGYNEIIVSGLSNLKNLYADGNNFTSIDLTGLTSLLNLDLSYNNLTNIHVNDLINLRYLYLSGNNLTSLEIGNLVNLQSLGCDSNQITELDLSNLVNLNNFYISGNQLTELDLSNIDLTNEYSESGYGGNPITSLNVKDGVDNSASGILYTIQYLNLLQYICCDASEASHIQNLLDAAGNTSCTVVTDCAPTLPETYYSIIGSNSLDSNLNGCDVSDSFMSSISYIITNGSQTNVISGDNMGNYSFTGKAGTYTVTPQITENVGYYTISPASATFSFPDDGNSAISDFCITPNGSPVVNISNAFKTYLSNNNCIDTDNDGSVDADADINDDGFIQITEAQNVIRIQFKEEIMNDFQHFTNVEYLKCSSFFNDDSNPVNHLDISPLVNLKTLLTNFNNISTLDLSNNFLLEELNCEGNRITSLSLQNNVNLINLRCGNVSYDSWIYINGYNNLNSFTSLDLSQNPNLEHLTCSYLELSNLDITQCPNLITLNSQNNDLSTLDVSNNPNLTWLNIKNITGYEYPPQDFPSTTNNHLTNLDVSQNTNLTNLYCNRNQITSLDVSQLSNLITLECLYNQIATLGLEQTTSLVNLNFHNNLVTAIDVTQSPALVNLNCSVNYLSGLDLNENPNIDRLYAQGNPFTHIFVKNGSEFITEYFEGFDHYRFYVDTGSLEYICADDFEIDVIQNQVGPTVEVNDYCSFNPGGDYYTIQGQTKLDLNNNGCDVNDTVYSHLKFDIYNGSNTNQYISNTFGDHTINVIEGNYTITPVLENLDYFTVTPSSVVVDFPTDADPFTQDFCIVPNGTHNDLEITMIPLNGARPGFDANYEIIYKNKGNTALSGSIDLTFQNNVLDLVSSNPTVDNQSGNNLSWDYSNLQPFESRYVLVTMNLNTPTETPALNGGDILNFTATGNPLTEDETPDDNVFTLNQTVVNSYDPNDKTCLEGETITPELVGKNVHYLIRFENTGSANAINVVVKDEIDISKFDISTLFLTDASHEVVTRIKDGNVVEFIFENINLPFDDANNDGYIAFKIKTLPTLVAGDTFENDAEIYFDFNFPIITNNATTSVEETLSINTFELIGLEVYPNPVLDVLHIKGKDAVQSVTVYDISGRLINQVSFIGNQNDVSISTEKLSQGTYFAKVKTEKGEGVKKIIKD